jgi:hypothetical protein
VIHHCVRRRGRLRVGTRLNAWRGADDAYHQDDKGDDERK